MVRKVLLNRPFWWATVVVLLIGAALGWTTWTIGHRHLHTRLRDHACLQNLRQIATAKQQWAADEGKAINDFATTAELVGRDKYLVVFPTCPQRGTYALGEVGEKPRCSIPGHTF